MCIGETPKHTFSQLFVLLSNSVFEGNPVNKASPLVFVMHLDDIEVCCKPIGCQKSKDLLTSYPCGSSQEQDFGIGGPRLLGTAAQRIKYTFEGKVYGKVTSGENMKAINVVLLNAFDKEAPQQGTVRVIL